MFGNLTDAHHQRFDSPLSDPLVDPLSDSLSEPKNRGSERTGLAGASERWTLKGDTDQSNADTSRVGSSPGTPTLVTVKVALAWCL